MRVVKYLTGLAVFVAYVSSAASETYVGEMLDKELKRLETGPDRPDAEIHVLKIYHMWDAVGPERVVRALASARQFRKVSPRVRNRVDYLLALAKARTGDIPAAEDTIEKAGYLRSWIVAGPFTNEGGMGFDKRFPPEEGASMDPGAAMTGNGHHVHWRRAPDAANHLGYLDLSALYQPMANNCFFARTTLASSKAQRGILRIGAGGTVKVYWNGVAVLQDEKYRMSDPDRLAAEVAIEKGSNTLLAKVCTEERGDFGLFARLTDESFAPLAFVAPVTDQLAALSNVVKGSRKFRRIPQPAETLFEAAISVGKTQASMAAAAEYLYLTTSQDLNTTEARDMAKAACLSGRSYEQCLVWSSVALDRSEQRQALDAAMKRGPDVMETLVAMARWEMDGPEPSKALPLIEKIFANRKDSLEAKLLNIDLLSRRGFAKSAFSEIEALNETHKGIPGLMDLTALLAEEAGYLEKATALKRAAIAYNFDAVSRHEDAAAAALAAGDEVALREHIANLEAVAPSSDGVYRFVSTLLEGIEDFKGAEAALRSRIELAPRNANAWVDLGLFLLRSGRRDQGVEALMTAAGYKPQDTWLAEYLKHLGPLKPFEEAFVIPDSLFLSWQELAPAVNESRFLVDQTVVKVYESGLSSRFVQQVFEINNREDAKDWQSRYIQFLPESQQVRILAARVYHPDGSIEKVVQRGTIPISEPWYRLYYDVAAEAVVFPKLDPGDVVELRYRIDDIATRNIFHDYFGDFVFIEDFNPKRYWRYAVIAPSTRELLFNTPSYPGLERSREKENGDVIISYQAEEIPSLHREGDMPGLVEVAAYLHVSTYKSWTELGKWYRGLVRHQMVPDARIKEIVRGLIRGKKKDLDKVEAIYDWVVTATRYVGLEFGIHGYKPYKAPMVVSRGFGDCKDKASLLVTMLTVAGIDAEFVLIRTNDLGRIPKEPASLAIFNHAIVHVPKLNLYLDGTAEQHGVFELPFGDQDATAVLLKASGAEFVTTPVVAPALNTTKVKTKVTLDDDGNADIETSAVIKGTAAAPLRKLLEVEATREKRFEGSLAAIYPGATLERLTVHSITDLSEPAAYTFEAAVPSFAVVRDNTLEIPVDEGLDLVREYARLPERAYDLILGAPRVLTREVVITLPDGYLNDDLPPDVTLDTPFGKLDFSVAKRAGRIEISRRFEFSTDRVVPDDYPAFVTFCRDVDAALSTRLVFRRAK